MSSWNDNRLDELSGRVDTGFAKVEREMKEGFAKVGKRFERVESEMREGFARVDKRFEQVDERFGQIDRRFEQIDERLEQRFGQIDRRFEQFATREEMAEVRAELRLLNQRFDRLLHTLVLISWGVAGSLLAALVGLIVALI